MILSLLKSLALGAFFVALVLVVIGIAVRAIIFTMEER